MPPFNSVPRAVARLAAHRNSFRQRAGNLSSNNQIRRLSSIAGTNLISSVDKLAGGGYGNRNYLDFVNSSYISNIVLQKRGFLSCGDGEEGGNMLSKIHEERRVLEQLFNVVAAVDMYEEFLPWCQRLQIVHRNPDGSFDAELVIGFKFLVESYMSHVELTRPNSIKTTSSQSSLFEHLINVWEFSPGPVPGSCSVYFLVDFKFQLPFYRQIANMFFKEVVSRLVTSFSDRCRRIYGPGVQVLENSYGQNS